MDNDHERDKGHTNSLVTEKDIDPQHSVCFTEETRGKARYRMHLSCWLKQHPRENEPMCTNRIFRLQSRRMTSWTPEVDTAEEISEELAAVPDADVIAKDSPIDPASPGEEFHGTDLLNGVGNHPEDETEEL